MDTTKLLDQINQVESEITRIKAGISDSEFTAVLNKIYGPYTIEGETFMPAALLRLRKGAFQNSKQRYCQLKLENLEYRLADLKSQLAKQEVE